MKNIFLLLAILSGMISPALAASPALYAKDTAEGFGICDGVAKNTNTCRDVATQESNGTNPVLKVLKIALNMLAFIAGVAAVVMLIINGLRLILSNGDSSGVSAARSGLIYVVVGLIIALLAKSIVVFVLDNI